MTDIKDGRKKKIACQETTEGSIEFEEPISADMKACQEKTPCQDAMEANLKKMEPNPGEKEAVLERQVIANEEVVIHSLKACRNERTAPKEANEGQ
jgi:hypothetical protein